jgi:hypothetical protein
MSRVPDKLDRGRGVAMELSRDLSEHPRQIPRMAGRGKLFG